MASEFEQDIATFWSLLFRVVSDGEKRLAAHMAAHDLTPPQFYVLKTLMENDGQCAIGFIARQHHLTNATMTGLVKRLEAMGLVQRERNAQDMRSVTVVLTPEGQQRFIDIQDSLLSQLRVLLELVSPEDRKSLIHFLSRYVNIVTQLLPVENISP
ncbi:MAG: MarR family transcriptional regulator [Anaerolineae bacterium]|nr:MarR family transcriptional regulator [Anaerolineae bacterium]